MPRSNPPADRSSQPAEEPRYPWFPDMELEFLHMMAAHQMDYGYCASTAEFNAWVAIWETKFPKYPVTARQFRGKKERYQKIFNAWIALTSETGMGWDPVRQTVNCTQHAWRDFKQVLLL